MAIKYTLKELELFYERLKDYKTKLESQNQTRLRTSHEDQELEHLREELMRQSAKFRVVVEELTGKRLVTGRFYRGSVDIWDVALSSRTDYKALDLAIDATNQAIGKLLTGSPSKAAHRYQFSSPVYWGEIFYQRALKRLWDWIKSHRKAVSWTTIIVIVVTLLGTNWELVRENIGKILRFFGIVP